MSEGVWSEMEQGRKLKLSPRSRAMRGLILFRRRHLRYFGTGLALTDRSGSTVLTERPEALAESLEGTKVGAGEIARL